MECRYDPEQYDNEPSVVALGCFDGVHIGHVAVIEEATSYAVSHQIRSIVWSFASPPKNAFLEKPVPLLTDREEKARLCAALGVDLLICPDFTESIRDLPAEDFVCELLCRRAGAVHIVCGENYTFGKDGRGNPDILRETARRCGATVTVVPSVMYKRTLVSSTVIRHAVSAGRIRWASQLLGREFFVYADIAPAGAGNTDTSPSLPFFRIPADRVSPKTGCYLVTVEKDGIRQNAEARVTHDESTGDATVTLPDGVPTGTGCRIFFRSDRRIRKITPLSLVSIS